MTYPEDVLDWLKLVLTPHIGPKGFHTLITRFGSPDEVLGRSEEDLKQVSSLAPQAIREIIRTSEGARDSEAQREFERIQAKNVRVVTCLDESFPPLLHEIPSPPAMLFVKGCLQPADRNTVAIVGTRRCDSYGLTATRKLAGDLAAAGLTITSGLALGIDGAAHHATLGAGGRTWAFLPCGFDEIYPPENRGLAEEIMERGALLSEYPMKIRPLRKNFPARNRLISGASLGVVIVQAPARSGALITARTALEQNREVFALPGRVDEPGSEGPHRLIQAGAKLVHDARDILDELCLSFVPSTSIRRYPVADRTPGPDENSAPKQEPAPGKLSGRETEEESFNHLPPEDRRIVLRLRNGPVHIDTLAADLDLPVNKVSERLLHLELQGFIRRLPGMHFDRV